MQKSNRFITVQNGSMKLPVSREESKPTFFQKKDSVPIVPPSCHENVAPEALTARIADFHDLNLPNTRSWILYSINQCLYSTDCGRRSIPAPHDGLSPFSIKGMLR